MNGGSSSWRLILWSDYRQIKDDSSPYTFKALCHKVQLLEDLMEFMKTISQKSIIYDFFKVIEVLKSSSLEVIKS